MFGSDSDAHNVHRDQPLNKQNAVHFNKLTKSASSLGFRVWFSRHESVLLAQTDTMTTCTSSSYSIADRYSVTPKMVSFLCFMPAAKLL